MVLMSSLAAECSRQRDHGPATEKTLLPTVGGLTGGTSRLLELAERSVRRHD